MNSELNCTGEYWTVLDGRKSFPSGHSSFSFATLGFLTFYLMGKLKIFSEEGRGKSFRLIFCFSPTIVAMLIGKKMFSSSFIDDQLISLISRQLAISRTMDYHHWKEDVVIGSMIGIAIAYMCYRQYFPSLSSKKSNLCYEMLHMNGGSGGSNEDLLEKDIKWI
jgi:diacylglycerol diphosphate phosphatase / phosphatidate phosphatase